MRKVLTMYSLGYPRDLLLSLRWAGPPLTPCICVRINSLITTRVRTRGCRGGKRRRPASAYTDITKMGDRAFRVAGPRAWNNLSGSIQATKTLPAFKKQLKLHLLRNSEH